MSAKIPAKMQSRQISSGQVLKASRSSGLRKRLKKSVSQRWSMGEDEHLALRPWQGLAQETLHRFKVWHDLYLFTRLSH